ncbi:MAG: cadherin-like beta sandwich domain-containing protein, partial [Clostridia bacterium]|nr:cadherin-like beta sandwich domain-containing protein [Clostridia bacterium]
MKKFFKYSILSLLFSFFSILTVNATDGYPAINASGTVESGKTFNVEFYANNVNGAGIMTVGGSVSSSNNTCIQFVSVAVPNNEGMAYNNKFAWQYAMGRTGNVRTAIATFRAVGTNCSATVSISDIEFSFTDSTKLKKGSISKNINVVTYSADNNLAELAVDKGSLSPAFNAGTTNYTVTVGSDVTSLNIYARTADAKATVAGAGAKNINYGSNKFAITVKAENGSTKAYTVNVIRQDSRSSNANLKSLNLSNGSLSPSFNSSVTEYTVSVPYEVSKINVNAVADDANAKVAVSSPELVAEGTTNITIKVTAENGASKTYVIKATRGKDPN